jgi:heme-degrading monooxygenase HmoA
MIARIWKGWTKIEDADSYEELLKKVVFPELQKIKGYDGGYIFRKDNKEESEFVITNLFENLEAIKVFAGNDYEIPYLNRRQGVFCLKLNPSIMILKNLHQIKYKFQLFIP